MSTVADQKALAAAAWEQGKYEDAVTHYTSALEFAVLEQSDKDVLKTLHGNRCAAYLKLGRSQEALVDATKCVEVDPSWIKGYSRKGDAFFALGKFTESYNAYNAGLRISPNDPGLAEKLNIAMAALRGPDQGLPSGGLVNGQLQLIQGILKGSVVFNCLIFALPFFNGIAALNYKLFVLSAFCDFAISLYGTYGVPQFIMTYVQRLLPDPSLLYLVMSLLLLMGRGQLTSMLPIFIVELAQFAYYISQVGRGRLDPLLNVAKGLVDRYLPSTLAIVGWEQLSEQSKWSQVSQKVIEISAMLEVTQGLMLIFELLFPTRNVMFTMIWWQFLQMRYMLDSAGNTKRAFRIVDGKIMALVHHQMCPAIVGTGYSKVRDFLSRQVQPPSADQPASGASGAGLSGLVSKCSIM